MVGEEIIADWVNPPKLGVSLVKLLLKTKFGMTREPLNLNSNVETGFEVVLVCRNNGSVLATSVTILDVSGSAWSAIKQSKKLILISSFLCLGLFIIVTSYWCNKRQILHKNTDKLQHNTHVTKNKFLNNT